MISGCAGAATLSPSACRSLRCCYCCCCCCWYCGLLWSRVRGRPATRSSVCFKTACRQARNQRVTVSNHAWAGSPSPRYTSWHHIASCLPRAPASVSIQCAHPSAGRCYTRMHGKTIIKKGGRHKSMSSIADRHGGRTEANTARARCRIESSCGLPLARIRPERYCLTDCE